MNKVNTTNINDASVNKLRLPNNKMPLIDNIVCLDYDKLYAWGCHLSYGQFHVSELKSGKALGMLKELP